MGSAAAGPAPTGSPTCQGLSESGEARPSRRCDREGTGGFGAANRRRLSRGAAAERGLPSARTPGDDGSGGNGIQTSLRPPLRGGSAARPPGWPSRGTPGLPLPPRSSSEGDGKLVPNPVQHPGPRPPPVSPPGPALLPIRVPPAAATAAHGSTMRSPLPRRRSASRGAQHRLPSL